MFQNLSAPLIIGGWGGGGIIALALLLGHSFGGSVHMYRTVLPSLPAPSPEVASNTRAEQMLLSRNLAK
jgi:hypothetical protein